MKNEAEFEGKLTQEDIEVEIDKIGDFFRQIPDDLKAISAAHFILEIVNRGSRDYFQALGIFQDAMDSYRTVSLQVAAEQVEEDLVSDAYEIAKDYRCIQELSWKVDQVTAVGEIRKIGYIGEDDRYSGGKRYEVFQEDGIHFGICQDVLKNHFEEVDNIN